MPTHMVYGRGLSTAMNTLHSADENLFFSCGHTQVKTRLPVRSVLFKHLRALPSIVVGDHTRTEGAAVILFGWGAVLNVSRSFSWLPPESWPAPLSVE